MKKVLTIILFSLVSLGAVGQQGIIRGSVMDGETGEALIGATVVVAGTSTGAATDLDGKFELRLDPGTYTLQVSSISYQTITIEAVEVVAGEVNLLENIPLGTEATELEEVVVTAEIIQTSEAALLTVKKKAPNLMDGISAQTFRQIGDGDAASAIKRVPGVSIEGGKYVYVRGLGDRYTKSILNGMDIPGLDPDRNTLQMDIFPTNVIDNIIVVKSFTADLPADFTGGIVDIQLKDFPEEKNFKVSASLGYNPSMHFNSNFLTYDGSSTDWLGFDNGKRDIPTNNRTDIPLYGEVVARPETPRGQEYQSILRSFDPQMAAQTATNQMNYNLGVTFGNQYNVGNAQLGVNLSLTYKNTSEFYENAVYGVFGKPRDKGEFEMEQREMQTGNYGLNDVLIGGLAGVALKTRLSKFRLNFLHLQNGTSKAAAFDIESTNLGANFNAIQQNLEYSQRSLSNILLGGTHSFGDRKWELEWKLSPTLSKMSDPDIRFTRYRVSDDGRFSINSESGIPQRIWRDLEEINLSGRIDLAREYSFIGRDARIKFGGGYTMKERDYNIQNFAINPQNQSLTGNPDELFWEENLWPTDDIGVAGVIYSPLFLPNNTNQFNSTIDVAAGYFSNEAKLSDKFKTILGLRVEKYTQRYSGLNQNNETFNNVKVLDDLDFFPTANLVYAITDNMNLRASYSMTIARPSFKEASFATIIDPLTGRVFIGGFFRDEDPQSGDVLWDGNLRKTSIQNFDLRWEMFQKRGQTIALSAFYKRFDNPIEIVQYVTAPNNFQPRNVGDGQVVGAEIELRKSLSFISQSLENFSVTGNFTITESRIDMSAQELLSRSNTAREGEVVESTRAMAGQAPYIVNAGIQYEGLANGFEAGLYYNVQGETLLFVGAGDRPDIYSVPFHNLKFNMNKFVGKNEKLRIGLEVENILGDLREEQFQNFNSPNKAFTRIDPGTLFTFNASYKF